MRVKLAVSLFLAGAAAVPSAAIDIQCRVVKQLGIERDDYAVLDGDRIVVRPGSSHRLRVQFMATADPGEELASFVGWFQGAITTTGGVNSRTWRPPNPLPRGRIPPFNFAPAILGAEGVPATDPFTSLTSIDCSTGVENLMWSCGESKPYPAGRGVDSFISIYEITTVAGAVSYEITIAGNASAAIEYHSTECWPPDCGNPDDPSDDKPTYCPWAPFTDNPQPFEYTLEVVVCAAEWNNDRVVNSNDFFDFLDDFFAGDADFNNDDTTNSQDFFDYIAAFFTPC